MIASVSGRVTAVTAESAVVEVGGVGLLVQCTPLTAARLHVGEPAALATSLVVREESLTLYGFADADERSMFELLLGASGIGPKTAQAALGVLTPGALRAAIAGEDVTALTRVPGIGRKGAQRLVLELKEKVGAVAEEPGAPAASPASGPAWGEQVRTALVGLGYTAREADDAVTAVAPQLQGADDSPDIAAVLRTALQTLSRR